MGGGLREPLPRNRAERRERERHSIVIGVTRSGALVHATRRHPGCW